MDDIRLSLKIKRTTATRLQKRMAYGDSYDSAIARILDTLDNIEAVAKPNEIRGITDPTLVLPTTTDPNALVNRL